MYRLMPGLSLALRSLAKSPTFTLAAVLTLALCVGANSAVFSLANAVLFRPLAYEQPDRLVLVWESAPFFGLRDSPVAPGNFAEWRKRSRSFAELGALEGRSYRLTGGGDPEVVRGALVTAGFWRALRTRPALGRTFEEQEDAPGAPRVAVISDGFWRRRFGAAPDVLGRTLNLNGEKHTVIGVLAPGSEPPGQYGSRPGDIWAPFGTAYSAQELESKGRHNWMVAGRLKDGVSREQADAEMKTIAADLARESPDTNGKVGAFVAPLRDHFVDAQREPILLLLGTAGLLLVIGCANLANLLMSRAASRAKEVALRVAMGARLRQLLPQFLWESAVLCGAGCLLGLALAGGTYGFMGRLAPGSLAGMKTLEVDWRVAGFTLAVAALTTAAFGLLPLWQLRRLDVQHALKQSARTVASAAGSRMVRNALVAGEVALAFVLLAGAGLLIRTLLHVSRVDPGFRTDHLLLLEMPPSESLKTPEQIAAYQSGMLRQITAIPGVEAAGFTSHLPLLHKGNISGVGAEGRDPKERFQSRARVAGPGYFRAIGIAVRQGRALDERDHHDAPKVAMINETLARQLWPGQDPLGRRLILGEKYHVEVVGIVADIRQSGLDVEAQPEFYVSTLQVVFPPPSMAIRTKVDPASLAADVRRTIWAVSPDQPVSELTTMDEVLDREVFQRRTQAILLGTFAALALLLACIGMYGVLAFLVGQQTAEIGLRMALGAAPRDVLRQMAGNSLRLTLAGAVVGLAGALALTRLLKSLLYGVQPTDPLTYVGVALLVALVSAAASIAPAWRAMKIEPVAALRQE